MQTEFTTPFEETSPQELNKRLQKKEKATTHAGKKSAKNRPQKCVQRLFKNMRGMLQIFLKL